jgi:hypothetical protein
MACGALIFRAEGEEPTPFTRRRTCRTAACRKLIRSKGPLFPKWREEAEAAPSSQLAPVKAIPEATLVALRIPAWLTTPVENSVENPVNN